MQVVVRVCIPNGPPLARPCASRLQVLRREALQAEVARLQAKLSRKGKGEL